MQESIKEKPTLNKQIKRVQLFIILLLCVEVAFFAILGHIRNFSLFENTLFIVAIAFSSLATAAAILYQFQENVTTFVTLGLLGRFAIAIACFLLAVELSQRALAENFFLYSDYVKEYIFLIFIFVAYGIYDDYLRGNGWVSTEKKGWEITSKEKFAQRHALLEETAPLPKNHSIYLIGGLLLFLNTPAFFLGKTQGYLFAMFLSSLNLGGFLLGGNIMQILKLKYGKFLPYLKN